MRIVRGPVFTHLLLADEINRAPAKTQSALLEVMQEYQVTLEGQTHPLPKPFMVLATQNPVETEGTYPLPEAQLDRFLFKIEIGYPTLDDEVGVVIRATTDQPGDQLPLSKVVPVLNERAVTSLQAIAARQRVDRQVIDYAVRLARATREWAGLRNGRRLARCAGAGARRARRGIARRAQLRDPRRRQAHRACRPCAIASRWRPTRCSRAASPTTCWRRSSTAWRRRDSETHETRASSPAGVLLLPGRDGHHRRGRRGLARRHSALKPVALRQRRCSPLALAGACRSSTLALTWQAWRASTGAHGAPPALRLRHRRAPAGAAQLRIDRTASPGAAKCSIMPTPTSDRGPAGALRIAAAQARGDRLRGHADAPRRNRLRAGRTAHPLVAGLARAARHARG